MQVLMLQKVEGCREFDSLKIVGRSGVQQQSDWAVAS